MFEIDLNGQTEFSDPRRVALSLASDITGAKTKPAVPQNSTRAGRLFRRQRALAGVLFSVPPLPSLPAHQACCSPSPAAWCPPCSTTCAPSSAPQPTQRSCATRCHPKNKTDPATEGARVRIEHAHVWDVRDRSKYQAAAPLLLPFPIGRFPLFSRTKPPKVGAMATRSVSCLLGNSSPPLPPTTPPIHLCLSSATHRAIIRGEHAGLPPRRHPFPFPFPCNV